MSQLQQIFTYGFSEIRTVTINNEPWFVAKDVYDVLGITDARKSVGLLDEDDRNSVPVIDALGRKQPTFVINESGMYSQILRSRKPEARDFKRWITSDVIHSIRKHGAYMTPDTIEQTLSNPDFIIQLATKLKEEQQARQLVEQQLIEQQPKVEAYDRFINGENSQTITDVAKVFGMSAQRLNRIFREIGVFFKKGRVSRPIQKYFDTDYFEVKEVTGMRGMTTYNTTQNRVTASGVKFINDLLLKVDMQDRE
ncbi:UNVERIFIED_CONTAM: anti-repressor protein [Brevibacillus sp. OAP136]